MSTLFRRPLLVTPLVEGPPGAMRRRATNNNQEEQIQERKKTQDDQDENTTGTDYPEDVPAVITKKRPRVRTITREGNHFKHKVNWCKNIWNCKFRKEGKCFCAHNLQEWIVANANARGINIPPAPSIVSFSIIFLIAFLLCSTIYLSSS
jgi:hypothetical protein